MKNIDRKKLKKFMLWFLFLSTFGVAGGITFLFSVIVPYEQFLSDQGTSQRKIDGILKYFVIGWVLFGFFVSFLYYRFLLRKKERFIPAAIIAFLTTIAAGTVTYLFFSANSTVVIASQGDVEVVGERFTFGPYPTMEDLERLKEEGYDGVITLLSPANPIEVPPLEKEKGNAKKAGITLHHYPMLPWVGDNKESIEGIKALVNEDDQKRYYVHCYLGRHRAGIVQEMIAAETGLNLGSQVFLLPTIFERGKVFHYNNQELIIGPYPTDAEWLTYITRRGVKEVISLISPESSRVEEEKKITEEVGIELTFMPINKNEPTVPQLQEIVNYAKSKDHKVYIHDFMTSQYIYQLEALLSQNNHAIDETFVTNESLLMVGSKFILGADSTAENVTSLKNAGVTSIISLTEDSGLTKTAASQNMPITNFSVNNETEITELYKIAKKLLEMNETLYIYDTNSLRLNMMHSLLTHLSYGWGRDLLTANFNEPHFKEVDINYNSIVGPPLSEEQWQNSILKNGVHTVMMIYSPSLITEETFQQQKKLAEKYGVEFESLPLPDDYRNSIAERLNKQNTSMYIMTAEEVSEFIAAELSDH
jgi:protein tyrosine phosphatase (PTP) superfamily phosphohydrolase (DUF442 family)